MQYEENVHVSFFDHGHDQLKKRFSFFFFFFYGQSTFSQKGLLSLLDFLYEIYLEQKHFSPVVIITLTEVFDRTVPSKILFPFPWNPCLKVDSTSLLISFWLQILRKRKYIFWRNGSVKNFCQILIIIGLLVYVHTGKLKIFYTVKKR